MVVNDSKKSPKVAEIFTCVFCDYKSCKTNDFKKHLSTDKHKKRENGSKMVVNDSKKSPKVAQLSCECGKNYKYDSGYYRHKKKCSFNTSSLSDFSNKELIVMLLKQNSELILQNSELVKNGSHNTTISNNTNSLNKTFNLDTLLSKMIEDYDF